METLGVLDALKSKPALRRLFSGGPPAPLTAQQVTNLFKVNYSAAGSSQQLEGEKAVSYWRDWLIDIEGMHTVLTQNTNLGNDKYNAQSITLYFFCQEIMASNKNNSIIKTNISQVR